MTLGRRVAVLEKGEVQQVAPPDELYRRPENRFVARFIGSPSMNLLACRVRSDGGGPALEVAASDVRIGRLPDADRRALAEAGVEEVELGIRPQDVEVLAESGAGDTARSGDGADATGTVELVESLGSETRLHVPLEGREETTVVAATRGETPVETGGVVGLRFRRDRLHLFRTGEGTRIEA